MCGVFSFLVYAALSSGTLSLRSLSFVGGNPRYFLLLAMRGKEASFRRVVDHVGNVRFVFGPPLLASADGRLHEHTTILRIKGNQGRPPNTILKPAIRACTTDRTRVSRF